jgi:hypothetical protein
MSATGFVAITGVYKSFIFNIHRADISWIFTWSCQLSRWQPSMAKPWDPLSFRPPLETLVSHSRHIVNAGRRRHHCRLVGLL